MKIGLTALDTGRIGIAAQTLGIAQAAFEKPNMKIVDARQLGLDENFSALKDSPTILTESNTRIKLSMEA